MFMKVAQAIVPIACINWICAACRRSMPRTPSSGSVISTHPAKNALMTANRSQAGLDHRHRAKALDVSWPTVMLHLWT